MTGYAPGKEIIGQRLFSGVNTSHATHTFDYVAQRCIDEALVQRAAAHTRRQHHHTDFTQQTRTEAERRAEHAFGERQ